MTQPSDRWSNRLSPGAPVFPGQRAVRADTGPESMTSDGGVIAPPSEGARRIGSARLRQIQAAMIPRDWAVLRSVDQFGFLTTAQVDTLHFFSHATNEAAARICRRVLQRLRRDRIIEPLQRRIGGLRAGSSAYIWRVGPAGDRLLRAGDSDAPRVRRKEPSLRFLEHRLAVADAACQLAIGARGGAFELLTLTVEPQSWRPMTDAYAARSFLKPDLFAVTATAEFEDHWFIEVDRATESLPTLLGQCVLYMEYRRSGREQASVGLFPRVLWLVPDAGRRDQLNRAIAADGRLDAQLFRVTEQHQLLPAITAALTPKGGADA